MADVRCYAGSRYPERPVAFAWEDGWLEVVEVLRQLRTPEELIFDVLALDGQSYRLTWDQVTDAWIVAAASEIQTSFPGPALAYQPAGNEFLRRNHV